MSALSNEIYSQLSSSKPNITNVTLKANEEKEFVFPNTVRKFTIQCREDKDVRIAFNKGETQTNYFTLKKRGTWFEDFIKVDQLTIYFFCESDTTIEILWWY